MQTNGVQSSGTSTPTCYVLILISSIVILRIELNALSERRKGRERETCYRWI